MYCNFYPLSTYLCSCDCDYSSMYSASLRVKSSTTRQEPPHESSCCCNYNPFTDETKDIEIRDLDFAIRKLAVMKCQMKKWRIERLQLESEARTLKNRLQSLGVNVNEPLKEDPLIIHYRDENIRLEKIKDQLEDKIKNLGVIISEHELHHDSCEDTEKICENMRVLREQSNRDKKKLKETIMELKMRLTETDSESSCAGVNRLRAKIRELIDQQDKIIISNEKQESDTNEEKSIDTLTATSKSCDDLQIENEQTRVENENFQRTVKLTADDVNVDSGIAEIRSVIDGYKDRSINTNDDNEIIIEKDKYENTSGDQLIHKLQNGDDTSMKMKLIECNEIINDLRMTLDQKDNIIESLKVKMAEDIEKMRMDREAIMAEYANDEEELQRSGEKFEELSDRLEQNSLDHSAVDHLKIQIETMQSEIDDLKTERDNLLDMMNEFQNISADKIEEINKIVVEKDKLLSDLIGKNTALQDKIDALIAKEKLLQKQNDELKENTQNITNLVEQNYDLTSQLTSLEEESSVDGERMKSKNERLMNDLRLSKEKSQILRKENEMQSHDRMNLQKNLDEIEIENSNIKHELNKCINKNEELYGILTTLGHEKTDCENKIKHLEMEFSQIENSKIKLQDENDNLNNTIENILSRLKISDESKESALLELTTLKNELDQLITNLDNAQRDNCNLNAEQNILKDQVEVIHQDLSNTIAENIDLKKALDERNFESDELQLENQNLKKKLIDSEEEINFWKSETHNVKLEIDKLKEELIRAKKELESSNSRMSELDDELSHSKQKNHESEILHEVLSEEKFVKDVALSKLTDLNEELDALKNELMNCRNVNEKLRNDLDESIRQHLQIGKDAERFKSEVEVLKNHNKKLENDNETLKRNIIDVQDDFQTLKIEADTLKIDVTTLTNENNCFQKENTFIKMHLNDLKNTNENLISELEILKSDLFKCHSDMEKLTDEYIKNKNELESSMGELEILKKKYDSSEYQRYSSESSCNALNVEKKSLLETLVRLREEIDDLKRNSIVNDTELREMEAMKCELIALKNELMKYRDELERCNHELDLSKKQIDILRNENEINKNQTKIIYENIDLQNEDENSEDEYDTLEKQFDTSEINIEEIKADAPSNNIILLEELNALKNTLGMMKKNLDKCNMENMRLQRDLDKWQNDAMESKRELDEAKKDNEKSVVEARTIKNKLENLNSEMDEMKLQNIRLEQDLMNMRDEMANITAERNNLNADNIEIRMNNDELLHKINEMKSGEEYYFNNLNKCTEEIKRLEVENYELRNEIEIAQQKLNFFDQGEESSEQINYHKNLDEIIVDENVLTIEEVREASWHNILSDDAGNTEKTNQMSSNGSQIQTVIEHTQPEDMEHMQIQINELLTEIERLKEENMILKSNKEDSLTVHRLLDELDVWKHSAENLKKENMKMKSDLKEIRVDRERLRRDTQLKKPSQISRERPNAQILSDTPDISNELIRALDVIRMKMEKQRKGTIRIRENIDNLTKRVWSKLKKYIDSDDTIVLDTSNPIIAEVLELSNDLSSNIFSAEKELINLGKVWRAQWKENPSLEKLDKDVGDVEASKTLELSGEKIVKNRTGFDAENWIGSLTLTQLADIHDKICQLTTTLVGQDSAPVAYNQPDNTLCPPCNQDNLQQSYDFLNKKIAELQRQIVEKQTATEKKVFEMRQVLRQEQAELIRISDAMNQERKRNLILHLTIDEEPCWINDCTAECAKSVNFIPNVTPKKR